MSFGLDVATLEHTRELGRGIHSVVFLSKNKQGKEYAVKRVCCREGSHSAALIEMDCLVRLKDVTGVIQLMGVSHTVKSDVAIRMVMKPYPYTLHTYIRNKSLDERLNNMKEVMDTLLVSLHYLKLNRIIHQDIKPENILIDDAIHSKEREEQSRSEDEGKEGRSRNINVVLADFSISTPLVYPYLSARDSEAYTQLYRPPEVCAKLAYGYPADMWALGMTMLEYVKGVEVIGESTLKYSLYKCNYNENKAILNCIVDILCNENVGSGDKLADINNGILSGRVDVHRIVSKYNLNQSIVDVLKSMLEVDPTLRYKPTPSSQADKEGEMSIDIKGVDTLVRCGAVVTGFIETIILGLDIMARYNMNSDDDMEKVALVCLMLSMKLHKDTDNIDDCVRVFNIVTKHSTSIEEIISIETRIISQLKYKLSNPDIDPLVMEIGKTDSTRPLTYTPQGKKTAFALMATYRKIASRGDHPKYTSYTELASIYKSIIYPKDCR